MAGFNFRPCDTFIDVEAPALWDPPKKRSASAPRCSRGRRPCSKPDQLGSSFTKSDWMGLYLSLLPQRAAALQEASPNYTNSVKGRPIYSGQGRSEAPKIVQKPTGSMEVGFNNISSPQKELTNSKQVQSHLWPADCGNSKYMLAMSQQHARDKLKHMSDSWPGMAETQQCPHDKSTAMKEHSTQITGIEPVTTLMLCDLPCRLAVHEVVDAIKHQGFSDTFDFVYVPGPKGLHSEKKRLRHNLGYAFVNFRTPGQATEFAEAFADFTFPGFSDKQCYTKPATCQGYKANWKKHSRHHQTGRFLFFLPTGQ